MKSYVPVFTGAAALLFLLISAAPSMAATYFVRQGGDDRADGLKPATAFKTLLRASQALNHGDSLVIGPGSYRDSVFIGDRFDASGGTMSVTGDETGKLTGDPAGPVVIQPANVSDPAISFSRCRNIALSGLTMRGPGQGIKLERCEGASASRCTFEGLGRGLVSQGSQDVTVESSVFARCTMGLFIQATARTRLDHLTVVSAPATGIVVLSSSQGVIRNCIFTSNNSNLTVDTVSAPTWSSDYNVLTGATGPWGSVPVVSKVYEWNAATSQDRHSVYVVPSFVNPETYDLRISPDVTWAGGLPGQNVGMAFEPNEVIPDRDGRSFRAHAGLVCVGAYEYPDPVAGPGWKKLPTKIAGGPRQSAGIYRPDGSLVRTLLADAAGVQELWWDGLDDQGQAAGPGPFDVHTLTHDVRLVDDGAVGDNGTAAGAYNPDNVDRVVTLPGGGFLVTAVYDEAGYTLRRFSANGMPIFGTNLHEDKFWGLARYGADVIGARGFDADPTLVRLVMPGDRGLMANGDAHYSLLAKGETATGMGLAVVGDTAYVALSGLNVVRSVNLRTGAKLADWPIPQVADITSDPAGSLWVISGQDIVSLDAAGHVGKRYPTGLQSPAYLAANATRLAAVDRKNHRLAVLDSATGTVIRTIGVDRSKEYWLPVQPDTLRDPRDAAFLPDGRLVLLEESRIRIFWPARPDTSVDLVSDFVDSGVVHPTNPEYLYCSLGIYQVDPKTGSWKWVVETPPYFSDTTKETDPWYSKRFGMPAAGVVLGGRPFVAYHYSNDSLALFDVSDPLKPRLALQQTGIPAVYSTMTFTKGGDIVFTKAMYTLEFTVAKFKGLDAQNNPMFDFANLQTIGLKTDPSARDMKEIGAMSADEKTGDLYYLAVTSRYNKMVPAWGADGTGVGRSAPDGTPLWFSLSSGGNYMSIGAVNDGKQTWVLASKSFGGQVDVFAPDGLRVTTGNWSFPCNYTIGFVDVRSGCRAYIRPDGKVGAYIEDDAIGRLARCRMDGAPTLQEKVTPLPWDGASATAGPLPVVDQTAGAPLAKQVVIPLVPPLLVNGDWSQWERNGVAPQIVALPSSITFRRNAPDDLLQTFRAGTYIAALAHDDHNFYVYVVATDDTPHFDATTPNEIWMYDGVELWLEEEQFGIGLLKDGTAGLRKWRFHDHAGAEWKGNYDLPAENAWGQKLDDLSTNPLGQLLSATTGVSFQGKPGYALMARIPYEEVKLVGGAGSGRPAGVVSMTGQPGEVIRVGMALDCISAWGHVQDYMVAWPISMMYSDPTRSYPCVLGK